MQSNSDRRSDGWEKGKTLNYQKLKGNPLFYQKGSVCKALLIGNLMAAQRGKFKKEQILHYQKGNACKVVWIGDLMAGKKGENKKGKYIYIYITRKEVCEK